MSKNKQPDERFQLLQNWLRTDLGISNFELAPASADASFRRYFRLSRDGQSQIIMDAPPDKEDTGPFVGISQQFEKLGLNVPVVIEQDEEGGFLLLSDLGSQDYLSQLSEKTADSLYGVALEALLKLQSCQLPAEYPFPSYDRTLLMNEMALFQDWYLERHLGLKLSEVEQAMLMATFEILAESALSQPQVVVHRDYHSRNLMVSAPAPGVLDFQDAVIGPITYDLVSLLRDCYVAWPADKVRGWVETFYQSLSDTGLVKEIELEQFIRWFDLMGIQRHLKATGIFSRLNYRDGKAAYLDDIPRTMGYVKHALSFYPALAEFSDFVAGLEANGETYLDLPK